MRAFSILLLAVLPAAAYAGPTCPTVPCTGNAWHIPLPIQPDLNRTMRTPSRNAGAAAAVEIVSGNQFQGAGGNPGNQLQVGSAVLYRVAGSALPFSEAPMSFLAEIGNNKYYLASIAANTFREGDVVEYYLRIPYSDHPTTFVYGNDLLSLTTSVESLAQASPFAFTYVHGLTPRGPKLTLRAGDREVSLYSGTGHVSVVAPDRAGNAGGLELDFAPPQAVIDGRWLELGEALSSTLAADHLDVEQRAGAFSVRARISTIGTDGFRYEVIDWNGRAPSEVELSLASDASERFFGLGEKFDALDQTGKRVHILTADTPGNKGNDSYKVAPWMMSTRGFGVLLDSTAESFFDLKQTQADRATIDHLYGTLAYDVLVGPEPSDVLRRYTARTGRPWLPPPWVFAPWMSSDQWRTGGEVRYVITKYREYELPGSVFVFDSPWETAYNDFTWNTEQFSAGGIYEGQQYDGFATPRDMLEFLRSNGFKVVVWLTPFVNMQSNDDGIPGQNRGVAANYQDGADHGYFVQDPFGDPLLVVWWKGVGSPIDFTNPAARTWFKTQLGTLVTESGGVIGGFKSDDGEADFIPVDANYFDGRTGIEMRNGYSVEYHRTVSELLGENGVLFARSGYTGTGAFPACWAGDNEPNFGFENGLPSVIIAGQSAALSGFPIWGHDIGGYQETNVSSTPENLFMRWAQFGAFSPIMQMHRQVGMQRQFPWSYGQAGLDNYRIYTQLHTSLFPYIYSMAKEASETGMPIIRALVLAEPDDPASLARSDEYLFGDAFLVAPMITNVAEMRSVWLPAGNWFDFFSRERHQGGRAIAWANADQAKLPLFVREGSIIPMISDQVRTLVDFDALHSALKFLVDVHGTSERTLYDGTVLHVEELGLRDALTFTSGSTRAVELEVRDTNTVLVVQKNGASVPSVADQSALDAASEGWLQIGEAVFVKIAHVDRVSNIVVSAEPLTEPDAGGAPEDAAIGTDAEPASADAGPSIRVDAGLAGGGEESSCGCTSSARSRETSSAVVWLVVLALVLPAVRGGRPPRARANSV